jgi:hypothetical protein
MRMRNVSNPYLSSLARYKNSAAPNFWREFRERLYSNPRVNTKGKKKISKQILYNFSPP